MISLSCRKEIYIFFNISHAHHYTKSVPIIWPDWIVTDFHKGACTKH